MDDIETVVVGEGGPVLANAFRHGTVDAIAGALPDWLALQANGIEIRDITPPEMAEPPANSFVLPQSRAEALKEPLQGFVRAWAKGAYVGQLDRPAAEMMARKLVPEAWTHLELGKGFPAGRLSLTDATTGEVRP